jgi:hypothetical protein
MEDATGRRSSVHWRIVTPFGPNHFASRSLSVQARHTRLRGASKTRLMKNGRSATVPARISAT